MTKKEIYKDLEKVKEKMIEYVVGFIENKGFCKTITQHKHIYLNGGSEFYDSVVHSIDSDGNIDLSGGQIVNVRDLSISDLKILITECKEEK